MEELDYWRLCEELSIVQAALLVVGEDPSSVGYVEDQDVQNRPAGYEAAKTAIYGALRNFESYQNEVLELEAQTEHLGVDYSNPPDLVLENADHLDELHRRSVAGKLVPRFNFGFEFDGGDNSPIEGSVNVYDSTVRVDSLKQWLRYKGFTTGFFFPEPVELMDFLDPLNPRYAPKLAAAVRAWQAVTNAGKRSPKQALDKWLREHAAEFDLTNDEGKPVEQAIEECSKVANWKPGGGATKTPT